MAEVGDITRQTLAELGVSTAAELTARFAALRADFERESASARDEASCKALRDAWLGRKAGIVNRITDRWLKPASPQLRPLVGQHLNDFRKQIEQRLAELQQSISAAAEAADLTRERVDLSLPGVIRPIGSRHLIGRHSRKSSGFFSRWASASSPARR